MAPSYTRKETAKLRAAIGAHLKAARKAKKLTQAMVAKQIGVGTECYRRIECGQTMCALTTLLKLVDLFELSFDSLLGVGDTDTPMPPVSHQDSLQIEYIVERTRGDRKLLQLVVDMLALCKQLDL